MTGGIVFGRWNQTLQKVFQYDSFVCHFVVVFADREKIIVIKSFVEVIVDRVDMMNLQ